MHRAINFLRKQNTSIMIPVQFITHQNDRYTYEEGAMMALEGGCRWIQLRMKGATDDEVRPVAERLKRACAERGATLIVDDRVMLARELELDGVHLGREDMPVAEARGVLGDGFLIGGTANTIDDIRRLRRESADYIGAGPFRFTTTKEHLAPLLGLEGYRNLIREMQADDIPTPLCAIGGIRVEDVMPILGTGVRGVAVSSAVLEADDPVGMMRRFLSADEETRLE